MEYEKRGTFSRFITKIVSRFVKATKTEENTNGRQSRNMGWLPGERNNNNNHDSRFDRGRMRDNISEIMD